MQTDSSDAKAEQPTSNIKNSSSQLVKSQARDEKKLNTYRRRKTATLPWSELISYTFIKANRT